MKILEVFMAVLNIKDGGGIPSTISIELLTEYVLVILSIIYPFQKVTATDGQNIIKKVFSNLKDPMDGKEVLYQLNSFFPSLNKILGNKVRTYIFNKQAYEKEASIKTLASSTGLKDNANLLLLPLLIPQIPTTAQLQRLYVASTDGFSFNRLANSIKYYPDNLIILLHHTDPTTKEELLIGIFNEGEVKDQLKFGNGNVNNAIFSLSPKLSIARAYNGKDNKYCYLNTRHIDNSDYKRGLAFGGTFKKARLWLDSDFPYNSYLESRDDTYEIKQFLPSPELNITEAEIWGLGTGESLVRQQEMVVMDAKLAEQSRKVDKKAFLEGDFNKEYLLEGTFAHNKDKH